MKNLLVALLLFFVFHQQKIFATHNRAGEITYRRIGGYTYEITIVTYTSVAPGVTADRNFLPLLFGDGDSVSVKRTNGPDNVGVGGTGGADGVPDGELIGNDTKKNIYITTHTYQGPSEYTISVTDLNRNENVINIPASVSVAFSIKSVLVVNPLLGANTSPQLLNPPIDRGCRNKCFYHNPVATDPDGDSLSYELVPCSRENGIEILGYTLPNVRGGGTFSIDPITGDLSWCTPQLLGEYNIAILIKEWRKDASSGEIFLMGSVLRDMQIDIGTCDNNPPDIASIEDTCVEAGTFISIPVIVSDQDNDLVSLNAVGGPLSPYITPPTANFISVLDRQEPYVENFSWQTTCDHIRKNPYTITFKAKDNNPPINLVDFQTFFITIVAPPVQNFGARPFGSSIALKWNKATCNTPKNAVLGYKLYRHDGKTGWLHGPCETGVPAYTNYTLIKTFSSINDTAYVDDNGGTGLIHGTEYCYLLVVCYADGSISYSTEEQCTQLVKDVPIITHVTVDSTSQTAGKITIKWIKPLADTVNFDTTANPGPYEFKLMQAEGTSGNLNYTQIQAFSSNFFANLNDTIFQAINLNTEQKQYTYKVDFYANQLLVGSTHTASSIFLSSAPSDNSITLSWNSIVPWTNYRYKIYKKNSQGIFEILDSTSSENYTDTALVNGTNYCYKIEAFGQYSDTAIEAPLINFSQEKCDIPVDLIPPCAPNLSIVSACLQATNELTWTNPNSYCADDVYSYKIYYSKQEEYDSLPNILTINSPNDTNYVYYNPASIAGCFAVASIDSTGNEGPKSNVICVDNCPLYELPNVFSPGSDSINDFFKPFPYRYVKDIDLKIYDRWGTLVYETKNPDINWAGQNQYTKKASSDGVYYYVCIVNEIRVRGILPRELKGYIHLFQQK